MPQSRGMGKSGKKDLMQLLRRAKKQGFRYAMDGAGHWLVTGPDGQVCHVPSTPSGRGFQNATARLKKIGLRV